MTVPDWFLSHWTWPEIVDLLVKLSPAATIIGAIVAAKIQFRSLQRINAESIAKNDYRAMLETLLKEADLVGRGTTADGLAALRSDTVEFARYRFLFGIVAFAMQEIYFAMNAKRNAHWATVIRTFMRLFKPFMDSGVDFTSEMDDSVHPEFADFVAAQMAIPEQGPFPASVPAR